MPRRRKAQLFVPGPLGLVLVAVLAPSCALVHERPEPIDASVVPAPDAFVPARDAFVVPPQDAYAAPVDALDVVDAALLPLCPTDQTYRPVALDRWFWAGTPADLDGDGQSELVVLASEYRGGHPGLQVLDEVGGALASVVQMPGPADWSEPWGVDSGDLDGDGDVDVVASLGGERFFENVAGTLVDRGIVADECFFESLEIGDLDGDGDADIVGGSCDSTDGAAYALVQDHGAFTREGVGGHAGAVYARMLHHAGSTAQRVVAAETYSATFGTWERAPTGWTTSMSAQTHERVLGIVDADLDADGDDDFVLLRGFRGYGPLFFRVHDDGTFEPVFEASGDIGPGIAGAAADVDDDGDVDLMFASALDGTIWLYEAVGPFAFVEHRPRCRFQGAGEDVRTFMLGDFAGSGTVDLAVLVGRRVELVSNVRAMFGL